MSAEMKLPKITLGAWVWRKDGIFVNNFTAENLQSTFDTVMARGRAK